ncbi:MAG: TonB-dependent receptor [Verrucomicrobiota bacterium]|nr:TonB-dependent receptor [Verrucomicrobiota bacterium]
MTRNVPTKPPLRWTAVLLTLTASAIAFAQEPPAAAGGGTATTERVIVTGSYIPTAETESALPVTVYTAEILHKQGANTPVEGLRQLPSFVGNAATENDANGGNGAAGINLRGVGQQNTLVLLNGRRASLGTDLNGSADINAIPIGAIARTEVLKDGASAIYGSDAVAGVVNFILLDGPGEAPYEGAEVYGLYGNTTESDAHVRQFYLRGGVKTDKVQVAAVGEYYSRANLYSRDRAQLAGTGDLGNDPLGLGRGGGNGNSPTFAGRVSISGTTTLAGGRKINGQLVLLDPTVSNPTPASYRRFEPTAGNIIASGGAQPGDFVAGQDPSRFNFRVFTPAIPAVEKAMYYVTGRYKIFGEGLQIYGDVMYSKAKQDNGLAPSPFTIPLAFYKNANLFIPNIDPRTGKAFGFITPQAGVLFNDMPTPAGTRTGFSTAAQRSVIQNSPFNPFPGRLGYNPAAAGGLGSYTNPAGALSSSRYRLVNELGNRRSFYDADYYRYTGGLNGDFNIKDNGFISHFGYDTGIVYERFDKKRVDSDDATRGGLYREIINGNFDPFIGQNAPVAGVAPIYDATGAQIGTRAYDNRAAAQRASYLGNSYFYERSWLADAKINAHLFPNLYNGGLDLALGYEHREDAQKNQPDPVQLSGDQLGFAAASNFKFLQKVNSFFVELNVPIVTSTMNVPFVRSLEFSIAWRYEKFDNRDQFTHATSSFDNRNPEEDFGGTPRLSVRYQPMPDLTLRANFNQSFLTPTPFQLFAPTAQNFPVVFDPVNNAVLQPPGGVFQFGNPALIPEKTDSYSAGLVYTPKWLPGFTLTADWYQLNTRDLLLPAAQAAQVFLTLGITDPDGAGGGAVGISRNDDGTLNAIDAATVNAGKRMVQGMDITTTYEIPTQNWGTFTLSGGWNHFFTWKAQPLSGYDDINFLGDFQATQPLAPGGIPFNKAFLRFEWAGTKGWMKGLDFVATGNYIGDLEDDPNFIALNAVTDPAPGRGGTATNPSFPFHHRISDYETLDMQLSYEFLKPEMQAAAGGYSKDAKDAKSQGNDAAGVENSSIWQRMLWNTKVTVGVNNAFDRYPPTVLGAFNDNYDTSNYTIRNRYWYVSLTKKF